MKTLNFITKIAITLLIPMICSCEKSEHPEPILEESTLYLSIISEPRTKVEESPLHGNQEIDNKINSLDIFIFHNHPESANHHMLDVHKSIDVSGSGSLEDIEIQTTTGEKTIITVANSHREDWTGITTFADFTAQEALLSNEEGGEFTMSGTLNASLGNITSLPLSLSRLVGRVQVNSIRTSFAETPYEGASLSEVKIYLINVHGNKQFVGLPTENKIILNHSKLEENDVNSCAMPGIIYDQIPTPINDGGHNTKHYFYAYENTLEEESNTEEFTRLIIEAKLNGVLYYYPISINQEGFGYTSESRHKGIKRNTSYSIDVIILRPGSLDPNKPIEHGTLNTTINISNWELFPHTNIEF